MVSPDDDDAMTIITSSCYNIQLWIQQIDDAQIVGLFTQNYRMKIGHREDLELIDSYKNFFLVKMHRIFSLI